MNDPEAGAGSFSRRTFLKGLGTSAVAAVAAQTTAVAAELEKVNAEKVLGPGPVPITLTVNGKRVKLALEPRVTLLDALRNYSSLTGAKEGCDRAACGACTVLLVWRRVTNCPRCSRPSSKRTHCNAVIARRDLS
jgi:xanthine dehydrogenase YagT iron-sulfur-binding subunit